MATTLFQGTPVALAGEFIQKGGTNAVEGFHRQVRKVTKTKGVFPNDMALMKLIYLAVMNISKKWTQPLQNWALTAGQLRIKFGERMPLAI